ncbi:MAG: hypothetical protein FJX00_02325 [Alphaproteobacteria bacterium]|nr:hypothetical protein [Alphaproteobacteria bacterium]
MVCAKSTPVVVKNAQSFSMTAKKVAAPRTKITTSATKTPLPVSLSGGATMSAALAFPAVVQPPLPVLPKTPSMPNTPTAPQSPIVPTALMGFGNFWNNMSSLTTANTTISMNTGNYFGPGATIMNANLGNVNIGVAPSVKSYGPSVYW